MITCQPNALLTRLQFAKTTTARSFELPIHSLSLLQRRRKAYAKQPEGTLHWWKPGWEVKWLPLGHSINKAGSQQRQEAFNPGEQVCAPPPPGLGASPWDECFTAVIFWVFSGSEAVRAAEPRLPVELLRWECGTVLTSLLYTPPELKQPWWEEPSWTRPTEYFSSLWAKWLHPVLQCKWPGLSS